MNLKILAKNYRESKFIGHYQSRSRNLEESINNVKSISFVEHVKSSQFHKNTVMKELRIVNKRIEEIKQNLLNHGINLFHVTNSQQILCEEIDVTLKELHNVMSESLKWKKKFDDIKEEIENYLGNLKELYLKENVPPCENSGNVNILCEKYQVKDENVDKEYVINKIVIHKTSLTSIISNLENIINMNKINMCVKEEKASHYQEMLEKIKIGKKVNAEIELKDIEELMVLKEDFIEYNLSKDEDLKNENIGIKDITKIDAQIEDLFKYVKIY
uniref:Syntaxin, Qa-SNARE family n=1 Tax=Parastrongyloides trichosuri TaxID=131310 RepID=A0A0N4Z181_PARTI